MIKFFRRLFCRHLEVKFLGKMRILGHGSYVFQCAKCGKPMIYRSRIKI